MSAGDLIEQLAAINQMAAFNRWAGFEVAAAEPGRVELRMSWREEAGQYAGFLHAGVIAALLDTACGYAAFTLAGRVMASHVSFSCLSPASGVAFLARGEVVKAGRRQIFTRAELLGEDEAGMRKLLATGEVILMPWAPAG